MLRFKPIVAQEKDVESLKSCQWCTDHKGRTDLNFSVIDDDFCQYVKNSMIKFCPFCGRELNKNVDS